MRYAGPHTASSHILAGVVTHSVICHLSMLLTPRLIASVTDQHAQLHLKTTCTHTSAGVLVQHLQAVYKVIIYRFL